MVLKSLASKQTADVELSPGESLPLSPHKAEPLLVFPLTCARGVSSLRLTTVECSCVRSIDWELAATVVDVDISLVCFPSWTLALEAAEV